MNNEDLHPYEADPVEYSHYGITNGVKQFMHHNGAELFIHFFKDNYGMLAIKEGASFLTIYSYEQTLSNHTIPINDKNRCLDYNSDYLMAQLVLLTLHHIRGIVEKGDLSPAYFWRWLAYDEGGNITRLPYIRHQEDHHQDFFSAPKYLSSKDHGDRWGAVVRSLFYQEEGLRWASYLYETVSDKLLTYIDTLEQSLISGGLKGFYESLTAIKKQSVSAKDLDIEVCDESQVLGLDSLSDRWRGAIIANFDEHGGLTDFTLSWLNTIIKVIWLADVSLRLDKVPAPKKHSAETMLSFNGMMHERQEDGLYRVFNRRHPHIGYVNFINTAHLPVVIDRGRLEAILGNASTGVVIDLVKYLYFLKTTKNKAGDNVLYFPGGFNELADKLGKKLNTTFNRDRIYKALVFLECFHTGDYYRNFDKRRFLVFQHGRGGMGLSITLLDLITEYSQERNIPLLEHPRGAKRTAQVYNFLGLSLSLYFGTHSPAYYLAPDKGLPLDENLISYLSENLQIKRKSNIKKHLQVFAQWGAIEIIDDAWIKLGPKNKPAESVILEGGRRTLKGRAGGHKSASGKKELAKSKH
jgi:hypothetical protein